MKLLSDRFSCSHTHCGRLNVTKHYICQNTTPTSHLIQVAIIWRFNLSLLIYWKTKKLSILFPYKLSFITMKKISNKLSKKVSFVYQQKKHQNCDRKSNTIRLNVEWKICNESMKSHLSKKIQLKDS